MYICLEFYWSISLQIKPKHANLNLMAEQEKLPGGKSTNENRKKKEEEMSFLEHLEVLRWHLVRAVVAVVIFAILAFANYHFIFDTLILKPKTPEFATNQFFNWISQVLNIPALAINDKPLQIININMAGQFATHIKISLLAGVILGFPYLFWEFWRFIRPALYEKEQKYATGAVVYSSLLFIIGILFGYYLIVPLSVNFLGSYDISDQITNQINLSSYISTVSSIVLAGGVVFELPVAIYFLSKVGLVTPAFMRRYRRHAYVVLLLLSAIITPPDVFSQIMVCFPLVFLYEIGIVISKRVAKKREEDLLEA
ncbi:Sec-independent protein translocase protein TatC [Prolixibacter bellariivorans]|uniref:Sec-independent protein translocase protein TatC n=2 Tax=Prolixibacter bellariivorans TaxID=314319 RepID=A0A5M4AWW4_9BACT|nr:Sec-independent protein translocase protein TatC [Prolixibacter bellariivorans]